jgi:hypothetical protein
VRESRASDSRRGRLAGRALANSSRIRLAPDPSAAAAKTSGSVTIDAKVQGLTRMQISLNLARFHLPRQLNLQTFCSEDEVLLPIAAQYMTVSAILSIPCLHDC